MTDKSWHVAINRLYFNENQSFNLSTRPEITASSHHYATGILGVTLLLGPTGGFLVAHCGVWPNSIAFLYGSIPIRRVVRDLSAINTPGFRIATFDLNFNLLGVLADCIDLAISDRGSAFSPRAVFHGSDVGERSSTAERAREPTKEIVKALSRCPFDPLHLVWHA